MLVLWERPTHTVGSLGARLHLDSGTLTPLLKRMEQAGLVIRRRNPQDERRVLVELTEAGRSLRTLAERVPLTLAAGCDLSPALLETLRTHVQGLVDVLSRHSSVSAAPPATEE